MKANTIWNYMEALNFMALKYGQYIKTENTKLLVFEAFLRWLEYLTNEKDFHRTEQDRYFPKILKNVHILRHYSLLIRIIKGSIKVENSIGRISLDCINQIIKYMGYESYWKH